MQSRMLSEFASGGLYTTAIVIFEYPLGGRGRLNENLNHDMGKLTEWLNRNKLQHHPTKTPEINVHRIQAKS